MRYAAWIGLKSGDLDSCVLSDISETGARIDVGDPKLVPDRFVLFLSHNGGARRACTVVWRKPRQVGVSFSRRLGAADRAKLTRKHDDEPVGAERSQAELADA